MAMISLAITQNIAPLLFTTFSEAFGGKDGLSAAQMGYIPMMIYGVMMSTVLIAGPLADRFGAKPIPVLGLVSAIAGLLIMAAAQNFETILFAAAIYGISAISLDVVLSPIVAAISPENRSGALNRLHTWFCIGTLLIAAFIAVGMWLQIPWRILLLLICLIPLLNLIGFMSIPTLPLIHEDHVTVTLPQLLRFRSFPLLLLIMVLAGGTEASMSQWLPTFAETQLGYTKAISGFALACFSLAMTFGRYGVGGYIKSHNSIRVMQGMALGAAVLYIAAGVLPIPALALASAVVLGLFVGCMFPTGMAISGDALPHGGATFYGLLAAAGCGGGIFSQWAIGEVAMRLSLTYALAMSAFYAIGLIGCLVVYGRVISLRGN